MDTKSKVLFQEAGSFPRERPANDLLLCADIEESPGLWKTRMGIGLSWKSGERISENSKRRCWDFHQDLKDWAADIHDFYHMVSIS